MEVSTVDSPRSRRFSGFYGCAYRCTRCDVVVYLIIALSYLEYSGKASHCSVLYATIVYTNFVIEQGLVTAEEKHISNEFDEDLQSSLCVVMIVLEITFSFQCNDNMSVDCYFTPGMRPLLMWHNSAVGLTFSWLTLPYNQIPRTNLHVLMLLIYLYLLVTNQISHYVGDHIIRCFV
jgi:hypothetical protein